ncbi:hypothetical protein [Paenibacillus daejeonensis]|uniref:hypothetical protein n=1 Tax=Paenibacillus daejeonensis TaxID=135193 RepID=UPI000370723A|nr:hypothetical protein [Paenibacillus daejeonensis]
MTSKRHEADTPVNERELLQYIIDQTGEQAGDIQLVLKHEQAYIEQAASKTKGEVDIDIDDLVDYIVQRRDVQLSELAVDTILEAEMSYLMDQGVAGYLND